MMINCADMLRRMCDRVETSDSCCSPFYRKKKLSQKQKRERKKWLIIFDLIVWNSSGLRNISFLCFHFHFAPLVFPKSFDLILIRIVRLHILCFYLDYYYGRSFKCSNELSCCDEAGFCDFRTIPTEYWWCNDKRSILYVCLRFHAPQNYT